MGALSGWAATWARARRVAGFHDALGPRRGYWLLVGVVPRLGGGWFLAEQARLSATPESGGPIALGVFALLCAFAWSVPEIPEALPTRPVDRALGAGITSLRATSVPLAACVLLLVLLTPVVPASVVSWAPWSWGLCAFAVSLVSAAWAPPAGGQWAPWLVMSFGALAAGQPGGWGAASAFVVLCASGLLRHRAPDLRVGSRVDAVLRALLPRREPAASPLRSRPFVDGPKAILRDVGASVALRSSRLGWAAPFAAVGLAEAWWSGDPTQVRFVSVMIPVIAALIVTSGAPLGTSSAMAGGDLPAAPLPGVPPPMPLTARRYLLSSVAQSGLGLLCSIPLVLGVPTASWPVVVSLTLFFPLFILFGQAAEWRKSSALPDHAWWVRVIESGVLVLYVLGHVSGWGVAWVVFLVWQIAATVHTARRLVRAVP